MWELSMAVSFPLRRLVGPTVTILTNRRIVAADTIPDSSGTARGRID